MKRIQLNGKFSHLKCYVDDQDYLLVSQFKWYGYNSMNTIYARTYHWCINKQVTITVMMHRLILKLEPGDSKQGDHKNHNGLNNCRYNLRIATQQQNSFNQRSKKGVSKYKGVCWDKEKRKWKSQINYSNNITHLGYFCDEKDAAITYDLVAMELFDEFAYLNFEK